VPDEPLAAKILVVDDTENNRVLVQDILEADGHTVVQADSGHKALVYLGRAHLAGELPDLILLDVTMPGMDGYEVCRRLRGWQQTHDIPVLMLTSLREVSDKVRGIEAGADDFLSRPVDEIELRTRVRSLVRGGFYRKELVRKRDLLERILRRWHSESVVEEALRRESLLRPGGSRRFVTVVFADLAGFTRFAEGLPPELVMERLNDVFAGLTRAVLSHHGTLDKYIGDCIMAFFGAPTSGDDDAFRAVRTAFEMQRTFDEVKKSWGSGPWDKLGLAIGIHSGEAIVGNVGSEARMEYTVIGDTVNVAARLQGEALGGQILLSETTEALVRQRVIADELGPRQLKNRTQPVTVFEFINMMDEIEHPARSAR
jgi:class 3 adenylate cyclase